MTKYQSIVKLGPGNELEKHQPFASKAKAAAHVATYGGFVAPDPGGSPDYWIIDPAAKTVTYDQARKDAEDATVVATNYQRERIYASVGDQLDMQYHVLLDDTTTWKDHIAAVKAAHPKPE